MASVALIRICSSLYLSVPIVNHAIDNFNEKDSDLFICQATLFIAFHTVKAMAGITISVGCQLLMIAVLTLSGLINRMY
jgi:hypothetical protein